MIEIINLCKRYKSKKGPDQQALKDINIELGSKGFVVILGKSGSGKTSLLNILGGLDKFDSGEIIIKSRSAKSFNNDDWDAYRNTHVGFIFQEFYLIEEFSVGKNIALALELQGYKRKQISKRVDEILKIVELDEYKNRKPNEISGGQKQRVAIARALVKDPDILLVDEPTGNLDSETGKVILDTLKKLSKDKLIVMVTHDESFSYEYGDRIIELKDGEIVSDRVIKDKEKLSLPLQNELKLRNSKLKNTSALRLAFSSLLVKKIRLFFMMILLIASLVFVGIAINFSSYNSNIAVSKTLESTDIKDIIIIKQQEVCEGYNENKFCYWDNVSVSKEDIRILTQRYDNLTFNEVIDVDIPLSVNDDYKPSDDENPQYYDYFNYVRNLILLDNVDSINIDLIIGEKSISKGEVLITDFIARGIMLNKGLRDTDYNDVIDEEILIYGQNYKIVGVIETDYEKYDYLKNAPFDYYFMSSGFDFDVSNYYSRMYIINDEKNEFQENINSISLDLMFYHSQVGKYRGSFDLTNISSIDNISLIGTSRLPENDNEVIIPLSIIVNSLRANGEIVKYDDLMNNPEFLNYILNKNVKLTYYYEDMEFTETIKLVGVYDNKRPDIENIIVSDNKFKEIYNNLNFKSMLVTFSNNGKDNTRFIDDLDDLNYLYQTKYSDMFYKLDDITTNTKYIFYIGSAVFAIFASVMIFIFISSSIVAKKKDIGTLRAIGAKGKDVAKIFILEAMIITLTATIISSLLVNFLIRIINNEITQQFKIDAILLYTNPFSLVGVFVLSIFVTFLASSIPVKRISKMKPINAIKNI